MNEWILRGQTSTEFGADGIVKSLKGTSKIEAILGSYKPSWFYFNVIGGVIASGYLEAPEHTYLPHKTVEKKSVSS